jgi:hypothetical protein
MAPSFLSLRSAAGAADFRVLRLTHLFIMKRFNKFSLTVFGRRAAALVYFSSNSSLCGGTNNYNYVSCKHYVKI